MSILENIDKKNRISWFDGNATDDKALGSIKSKY